MAALYDSVILLLLILVFIGFVLLQKEPPVPPIIRPRIKEKFQSGGSGSGSAGNSLIRTTEMAAANATICNLQPLYDSLQCAAYIARNGPTPPVLDPTGLTPNELLTGRRLTTNYLTNTNAPLDFCPTGYTLSGTQCTPVPLPVINYGLATPPVVWNAPRTDPRSRYTCPIGGEAFPNQDGFTYDCLTCPTGWTPSWDHTNCTPLNLPPKPATVKPAWTLPSVVITGSITNLATIVSITGRDPTPFVKPNDMIYFGYMIDVQGPYVVASVAANAITLSKKYVGPNLTNTILSVIPTAMSGSAGQTTPVLEDVSNPSDSGGQPEVYSIGQREFARQTQAQAACAGLGGTLARKEQLRTALNNGANWDELGWISDDGDNKYAPRQTPAPSLYVTTAGSGAAICYGVKS